MCVCVRARVCVCVFVCVCVCVCPREISGTAAPTNTPFAPLPRLMILTKMKYYFFFNILRIFGINSNLPNIKDFSISLKRFIAQMSNFNTVLPVRLSNYMWSFIKFRQLVKSKETIVIKNDN